MKKLTISLFLFGLVQAVFAAPATLTQSVTYGGETITMQLTLQNLRGSNFELWAQNAAGTYDVITPVAERSYLGTVDEYPDAISCGILQDDGTFRGAVYFDRGVTWRTLGGTVEGTQALNYAPDVFTSYQVPSAPTVGVGQGGSTTYGYDIGIDAEYGYYTGPGTGSVAKTFELIEYNLALTRAQYLRDALLRPYLGRVIIRTDTIQDPYTEFGGGDYLGTLRNHWNANHADANSDLVAGVTPHKVGGGLAWVGVVGTSSGYSVNDSGSSGSFDVVFRHEMGHNWNCGHYVGGAPEGTGFMGGNATGRFSGCEIYRVLNHRDSKISAGGILDAEGTYTATEIPPYASLDSATFIQTVTTSLAIDVLANDHDANGQSLSITSFDSTSAKGGTVAQVGPNLVYTAPGAYTGSDYFLYRITDTAGKTATGVVVVDVQPNDALRLYLPLDETSGEEVYDQSVFGNVGSVSTNLEAVSVSGTFANAIEFDGVGDHVSVPNVKLSANTVTLTAWIKPSTNNNSWAGIVFDRSAGANGLNFGGSELRYHWNDTPSSYNWNSGLVPPTDAWTFVALVVEPTKATIYMDTGTGLQSAVNNTSHAAATFGTTYVGRDPASAHRNFGGAIDDVRIYNYAMTQSQLQNVYGGGSAESPNPLDGATDVPSQTLEWASGAAAVSNEIYVGTSQAAVTTATKASPEYKGSTTESFFKADLSDSTTYYWRVDTVTGSGTFPGAVWSFTTGTVLVGDTILVNFQESSNQDFAGGQLIGPTADDSSYWNAVLGTSGSTSGLIDNVGDPTGTDLSWASSTTYWNNDGTGDDEHKLATGYLDDGNSGSGKGATVTLSNIPYATYKVYGLFATDQNQGSGGSTATVNFKVNDNWALGGNASTTAAAYGTIEGNHAVHGSYWTEIVPGSVQGNYWTVNATGATCSIVGELRNGTTRGTLTAVIIEDMGGAPTTNAPVWNSSPVSKADAGAGIAYSASLDGDATDADGDSLTFAKVSGPDWLTVAASGDLGGTPSGEDAGTNSWTVSVTDGITAPVEETLNIVVITAVDVANHSFELPGTVKQTNWESVPGWSSDSVAADSGVEAGVSETDGSWAGFLGSSDPGVWNLTDEYIAAGETYTLRFSAQSTGSGGSSLQVKLYYDDGGARTSLATLDAALTESNQEFILEYDSDTLLAAVGSRIGIELNNVVGGWVGFDNIRLTRTGAPDTDGDRMPDWWEVANGLNPLVADSDVHSDSDTYDNGAEYVTDTNPQDAGSYQTFSFELAPGSGDPTLRFITSAARNYVVEYRDDLTSGSWQDLGPAFPGTGSEMTISDTTSVPNRCYRLRIELP